MTMVRIACVGITVDRIYYVEGLPTEGGVSCGSYTKWAARPAATALCRGYG